MQCKFFLSVIPLAGKEDKPHTVLCLQLSYEVRCEQYLTVIVRGAIQLYIISQSVKIYDLTSLVFYLALQCSLPSEKGNMRCF